LLSPRFIIESRQAEAVNIDRRLAPGKKIRSNAPNRRSELETVARELGRY